MKNALQIKDREAVTRALTDLYSAYGYSPFKMSKFEEYDLYVENKDFLVSDRIISFTDTSGRLLALKPDVTLSIIKNACEAENGTQKLFYNENVYRVSKSTGAYKEIMQTGLECVGKVNTYDCAEVIELAVKSLAAVSDKYVLDVSHMGVISALMSDMKLSAAQKKAIIELIADKNMHDLRRLMLGSGIEMGSAERFLHTVSVNGNVVSATQELVKIGLGGRAAEAAAELSELAVLLSRAGLSEHVNLDFSVVNNMSYYNGIVFQGFIESLPSSILSGGRYDKLVEKMNKNARAIGFAVYLDMLDSKNCTNENRATLVFSECDDLSLVREAAQSLRKQGYLVKVTKERSGADGKVFVMTDHGYKEEL